MSLFTNNNFITQLLKHLGAHEYFENDTHKLLIGLIQAQVRKMVEKASKHMLSDRRENLTIDDIHNALKQMNHRDLIHHYSKSQTIQSENNIYFQKDSMNKDITSMIQQEMKTLPTFSMPNLRGRYIYINKKIPKINENHQLKCLEDIKMIKVHESEQKKKNFNIIRDQPQSQLTKEQIQYYNEVVSYLTNNVGSDSADKAMDIQNESDSNGIQVKGCINNVLPLILKFILNLGINQNCIVFILKALQNKFVWASLQYHLHQVLSILIAYEGVKSFQVGCKMGYIVKKLGQKYPNLYEIFTQGEDNWSNVSKKIGFQVVTGIPLRLSFQQIKRLEKDAVDGVDQMASQCLKKLIQHWSILQCTKQRKVWEHYGHVYWYSCKELQQDPYLNMY